MEIISPQSVLPDALKIKSIRISLTTVITWKWLQSHVYSLMYCKSTFLRKSLVALITMKMIFSNVYSQMCCKSTSYSKTLVTRITWKWFLPSVYLLMLYESRFFQKKILSHWSHKNSFSPVCTHWCIIRLPFWENLLTLSISKWILSSVYYLMPC